jgi:predicted transcriptional regulator
MSENASPSPTKGEFEILQVLWKIGPATVREVHAAIGRNTGYTTILKLLQIMTEKGLVKRDEESRAHIYHANISEKHASGDFMRELLDRVFGGSRSRLVMQALGTGKPTREELREIRNLLDEMEGVKK